MQPNMRRSSKCTNTVGTKIVYCHESIVRRAAYYAMIIQWKWNIRATPYLHTPPNTRHNIECIFSAAVVVVVIVVYTVTTNFVFILCENFILCWVRITDEFEFCSIQQVAGITFGCECSNSSTANIFRNT